MRAKTIVVTNDVGHNKKALKRIGKFKFGLIINFQRKNFFNYLQAFFTESAIASTPTFRHSMVTVNNIINQGITTKIKVQFNSTSSDLNTCFNSRCLNIIIKGDNTPHVIKNTPM